MPPSPKTSPKFAIVAAPKFAPGTDRTTGQFAITRQTARMAATYEIPRFRALVSRRRRKSFTARVLESDRLAYYRVASGKLALHPSDFNRPGGGSVTLEVALIMTEDTSMSAILTCSWRILIAAGHSEMRRKRVTGFNSSPVFIAGDQTGVGAPCQGDREAYLETGNGRLDSGGLDSRVRDPMTANLALQARQSRPLGPLCHLSQGSRRILHAQSSIT